MEFKGKMAVLVIMIAVMSSVGGGFLLNADDVTTCETRFDYVTDVAGAFTGTQADMHVEYNPQANLTGYSVFNPDSGSSANLIHGISYYTTGANGYWIQENIGNTSSHRVTVEGVKSTTSPSQGSAKVTIDGTVTTTAVIGPDFGLDNNEVRTRLISDNGSVTYRVLGVKLSDLLAGYTMDTNSVVLTVPGTVNGYPGFYSGVDFEFQIVSESSAPGTRYVACDVTYEASAPEIRFNPKTSSVDMGGRLAQSDDVWFLWGDRTTSDASFTLIKGASSETRYIDPTKGIQPVAVKQTATTMITETSSAASLTGEIKVPYDNSAQGTVSVDNKECFHYRIINRSMDRFVYITDTSGHETLAWVGGSDSTPVTMWWNVRQATGSAITGHIIVNYDSSHAVEYSAASHSGAYHRVQVTMDRYGISCAQSTSSVTMYDSGSGSHGGFSTQGQTLEADTTYTQTRTESVDVTYKETYWSNGYDNSRVTLVFQRPTGDAVGVYNPIDVVTDATDVEFVIMYRGGQWVAFTGFESGTAGMSEYGNWPAMAVTFEIADGQINILMTPVQSFESFTAYTLLNRTYPVEISPEWFPGPHGNVIRYLGFVNTATPQMRHEVVSTTVFLASGGLYTQDGVFSSAHSFPEDLISSLRINSVVRCGPAMILETSKGETKAVQTSGDEGWMWNGRTVRWADLSVIYVSDKVEAVSIAGEVYPGALYLGDQTYEKGHLYIRVGNEVTDVGETGPGWTMTLAGTWAFSSAYHTGMNDAASVVELGEAGVWQWNQEEFLVVFLAVMVTGTIICAWKIGYSAMDWIVTILAVAVIWTLFG